MQLAVQGQPSACSSSKAGSQSITEIALSKVQANFASVNIPVCFGPVSLVGTFLWKSQNIFCVDDSFYFV